MYTLDITLAKMSHVVVFAYTYTLDITLAKMSYVVVFAKTLKVRTHLPMCISFSKIYQLWASRYSVHI